MHDYTDEEIGELIARIKIYVFPKRIRVREFFLDFDRLRCGRVTKLSFHRGVITIGVRFTEEELEALATHFTEDSAKVMPPQVVNYVAFCKAVDEVFETGLPEEELGLSMSPSSSQLLFFDPKTLDEEDRFYQLMHKLAMLCTSRGVYLKLCYQEHSRSETTSPSKLKTYLLGKISKNHFVRQFPFKKEFTLEEIELIAKHYMTAEGDVHFMALTNDISSSEISNQPVPDKPRGQTQPQGIEWSQSRFSPVDLLRSRVVEKRVRVKEHFQDFDPLKKGVCQAGQVKAVFTILNLTHEIEPHDFDALLQTFSRDDGMFDYVAFCEEMDKDFVTRNLQKDPLLHTALPDELTTQPSRRNYQTVSDARKAEIAKLEEKIKANIKIKRINLIPPFKDMDKTNNGHVTRCQLSRVMSSMGFNLDEDSITLLCQQYCDLGNLIDFNYCDFLASVDVMRVDEDIAVEQSFHPAKAEEGCKFYFDQHRKIMPKGSKPPTSPFDE